MNIYKDLSDAEFKMWMLIQDWRKITYSSSTVSAVPSDIYLQDKLNKKRAAVFNILAGLRSKGVIR